MAYDKMRKKVAYYKKKMRGGSRADAGSSIRCELKDQRQGKGALRIYDKRALKVAVH
jgi:hypothetical protein